MSETPQTIAYCHSCGASMDVTAVAPFSNVECPKCGKHTRVKREFGPYTLVRRHAIGGMSMVFAAHDNTLNREVALKILSEEFSADERRIAAFEEEARITASFSHPNVVRVFTTGRAFGRFYIAMELVPGGHFEHQIRERGQIPEAEMLPLAVQIAQGLKAAHAAGLIHRDVKPGNILLDADGHAKLVDFGLALVTKGGKAKASELWATPYYVPPETVDGHPEDFRSDIYAFGATLFHALAGTPSCDEESMATDVLREAKKRVVPLGTAVPSVSAETCRIVDKAMAYHPADRYGSYDVLISDLTAALRHLKAGSAETSGFASRRQALKKRRDFQRLVKSLVVAVAVAGLGVWLLVREGDGEAPEETGDAPAPPVAETDEASKADQAAEIARRYREARAALEAGDYKKAAGEFIELLANPEVQEPTRTWTGVEAVIADFLDGMPDLARTRSRKVIDHISGLPADANHPERRILPTIQALRDPQPVVVAGDQGLPGGAPTVAAAMLAGLKNWEQGLLDDAAVAFQAAIGTELAAEDQWAAIYQDLAAAYLADHAVLTGPLFEGFADDVEACARIIDELDAVLATLQTRGRARFNTRAWQLDLKRHAKLLAERPAGGDAADGDAPADPPDLDEVMAQIRKYAGDYRFSELLGYLRSLPQAPEGASRESLVSIAESAVRFLTDLEDDLTRGPVSVEMPLRSGAAATRIAAGPDGGLIADFADGSARPGVWSDFTADALIALHRQLVRNPVTEIERLRRHECAIAFDWLAGDRQRATAAASKLAESSAVFRERWQRIAAGLPD